MDFYRETRKNVRLLSVPWHPRLVNKGRWQLEQDVTMMSSGCMLNQRWWKEGIEKNRYRLRRIKWCTIFKNHVITKSSECQSWNRYRHKNNLWSVTRIRFTLKTVTLKLTRYRGMPMQIFSSEKFNRKKIELFTNSCIMMSMPIWWYIAWSHAHW